MGPLSGLSEKAFLFFKKGNAVRFEADLFVSVPLNSELAVTIDAPDSVRDATGVSIPLGIPSKTLKIAGPTEQTISFVVK